MGSSLVGQTVSSDLALLKKTLPVAGSGASTPGKARVAFAFPGTRQPVKLLLGSTMWLYQNLLSPQISAGCLFEPSCSVYSVELLNEYGIIRGMICTADRLTRCNRMAARDLSYTRINPATGHSRETTDYYRLRTR